MDAAREFSEMPQARMGLTAFCHCTYGADTLELLTQCGFIGPAQEHAGAAEAASSTVWPLHVCAEQGAPSKPSSGIAPVGEVVGGPNTVGGPIVAVKTEAASKPTAASAELLRETCRCCTSTCFDFVCVARASRARYNTKVGKPMEDTGCLRAAVAGSLFCELCKCAACSKHNVGRTRFCFTKPCVTQHMPRPLRSQSGAQDETSDWSTADYCNMHGRHSLPETWPPSLKVAAKLGWLLMQNTPLDYLVWMDFADALAARRANTTVSCSDVTWLFMAHCIKWPVAVSRFHEYALRACDARVGTAAAIVDSLVRVLRDLCGQAFPQMHARMSSKGRMHSSTGIIACSVARALAQARPGHGGSCRRCGLAFGRLAIGVRAQSLPRRCCPVGRWVACRFSPRVATAGPCCDLRGVRRCDSANSNSGTNYVSRFRGATWRRLSTGGNPVPSRRGAREQSLPDTQRSISRSAFCSGTKPLSRFNGRSHQCAR